MFLEIEDVTFADQAVADEADADTFIGTENLLIRGCRQGGGADRALYEGGPRVTDAEETEGKVIRNSCKRGTQREEDLVPVEIIPKTDGKRFL